MLPGATDGRDAALSDANFVVVGAPLDVSTTFEPGTRFGPRRIRTFSEPFDDYDQRTGQHFSALGVLDRGDVHAWDDAEAYLEWLAGVCRDVAHADAVPLLLGGEHAVSVAGVRALEPEVFVCLDAHLDLYDAYDGNPLSHACATRRALEVADEAILLGVRTGSEAEWGRASEADVTVCGPERVADLAAEGDLEAWLAERLDGRSAYLSVDIDAADPAFAPGTGTMEPFGLAPRDLREAVRAVAPHASGFDVVEVNDRDDGQAAALAGKLLREFVFANSAATLESGDSNA